MSDLLSRSTAKQKYSFTKARRFLEPLSASSQVQYVTHFSSLSQMSSRIGTSRRSDFTQPSSSTAYPDFCPCPSVQPTSSFIDDYKRTKTTRAATPSPLDRSTPPPYAFPRYSPQKSHFATFYIASPGPGSYNPRGSLNSTGKYFQTKYTDTQSRSFARAQKRDFIREKAGICTLDTPGPGAYSQYTEFPSASPPKKNNRKGTNRFNKTFG